MDIMKHRNFKMVDYVIYGRGSFNQLEEIIAPHRKNGGPMIFLVDHFFESTNGQDHPMMSRIPKTGNDEIIFVDSESADATRKIAAKFTDKIFVNPWKGFVDQKRFAIEKTSNEWILNIDADERITEELKNEIAGLDFSCEGYWIPRENYFLNKKITTCGWNKDFQLRLFNKNKTELKDRLVHEGFSVKGKSAKLKSVIKHYSFNSIEQAFEKINRYSTLQAHELYKTKVNVSGPKIFIHGLSAFFRSFFSLKGYKDGMHGLIISMMDTLTNLLTYTKMWELQRRKSE